MDDDRGARTEVARVVAEDSLTDTEADDGTVEVESGWTSELLCAVVGAG